MVSVSRPHLPGVDIIIKCCKKHFYAPHPIMLAYIFSGHYSSFCKKKKKSMVLTPRLIVMSLPYDILNHHEGMLWGKLIYHTEYGLNHCSMRNVRINLKYIFHNHYTSLTMKCGRGVYRFHSIHPSLHPSCMLCLCLLFGALHISLIIFICGTNITHDEMMCCIYSQVNRSKVNFVVGRSQIFTF